MSNGNPSKNQSPFNLESLDIESLFSHFSDIIYILDQTSKVVWCNEKQAKMFKYNSVTEILGKNVFDFAKRMGWPDAIANSIYANDQIVLNTGKSFSTEEIITLDNEKRTFLSHKNPLLNKAKEIIGIIGISIDITEKKLNEQLLLEKQQTEKIIQGMHTLAASIAHELRTPLVGIEQGVLALKKYYPRLLATYKTASEQNSNLPEIPELLSEVPDNISFQINQALLFIEISLANLSMRKINPERFSQISIIETINTTLNTYPFKIIERKSIHWTPEKYTDFTYLGNITLSKHILFNLIKNALYFIKAARKGEITITLTSDDKGNYLIFKDTAKGITQEILPHIFTPFYTNLDFGTGVGLAFCKMVMESYNGDITCESKEGEFTAFILSFPKVI